MRRAQLGALELLLLFPHHLGFIMQMQIGIDEVHGEVKPRFV